ncbi:MAG: hypothetical protein LBK76_02660, partial [Verrucomicrobiales bacterium]|nr:hypothetical protein [Verrucomicrobiales bacterium]
MNKFMEFSGFPPLATNALTLAQRPSPARANSPAVKQLCSEKRLWGGFGRGKGVMVEVSIEVNEELAHDG